MPPRSCSVPSCRRKDGAGDFGAALAGKKLPADVAKVGFADRAFHGRDDSPELAAALTAAGNLDTGRASSDAGEMKQMVADVIAKRATRRGEAIYRRPDMALPEVPRHCRGGRPGWPGHAEHRGQRPDRLPHRFSAAAEQGR